MAGPKPKLHLPFALWPIADKVAWTRASAADDIFADANGARLAKTTLHSRWMAWRRFLGFLTDNEPDALKLPPGDRLTPVRVRRFSRHIAETNSAYSTACQIDQLYGAARTMFPGQDWSWLRKIKARLFALAPSPGAKGPVITSLQLEELGFQLMQESGLGVGRSISLDRAVQYRDGLLIAFVAHLPLRHKNLSALTLGRDVIEQDGAWSIVIPPEDSKTKIELDHPLPEILQLPFAIYLKEVRPRLLRHGDSSALWVSAKGGPLSYSALGPVITRHTTKHLGLRITAHDARDAAATTWAIFMPAKIGIARDLLGHSDPRAVTKHYNRARGIEATRTHRKLIAQIRNGKH